MKHTMILMSMLLAGTMQSTWSMEDEDDALKLEARPSELALSQFADAAKDHAGRSRTSSMRVVEPDNGSKNNEFIPLQNGDKDAQLVAVIAALRETVCTEFSAMWAKLDSFDERLGKLETRFPKNNGGRPASPGAITTSVERVHLEDDNS